MSTSENEEAQQPGETSPGMKRRTIIRGAAWSVPVVAAMSVAPLAAASATTAVLSAQVGGNISVTEAAGTASGNFYGGLGISNVTGTWDTGELNGVYRLTGPWTSSSITKSDGSAFVLNESIDYNGTLWTVYKIVNDASGVYEVYFTSPSRSISSDTVVELPPAQYDGTFTPGVPTTRNPIAATVSVSAGNVNGGNSVGNSSPYPA